MNLEKDLDPEQLEAVRAVDGPVLVLAGAGSGKTRVLTYRVAHLLLDHHAPQVLAVTFTRKAAEEMRSRVESLVEGMPVRAWVGTFHSLCAFMLRREAAAVGYPSNFVIYDRQDQTDLLKRVLRDSGIPERILSVAAAREEISAAKAVLLDPEEFAGPRGPGRDRPVGEVYLAYQRELRRNGALDFDDLITQAVILLGREPEILRRYQAHFPYVLVDEYQDTNHAQYQLLSYLAGAHRNLCVVGDDDQSIYSWRGADVGNILDFEKEFPEAKVIHLDRSYRCSGRILASAQALVSCNRRRKVKNLWTPNEEGERISFHLCRDEREEAEVVVGEVQQAAARGVSPQEMAVLYRTNAQSRALEDELRRAAIPYILVGATRFYDRREVRDILAYLKIMANPADSVSLLRVINVPPRGIGKVTIERLIKASQERDTTLLETLADADRIEALRPKARRVLEDLASDLRDLSEVAGTMPPGDAVEALIERTAYVDYLNAAEAAGDGPASSRVENVEELVTAAREYSRRTEEPTLAGYLAEVSLVADIDGWSSRPEAVNLMTLHNAKGLEFRTVFITGLEEGLLPHITSLESRDPMEVEEERRLLYVGLTRAREKVHLLAADDRIRYRGRGSVDVSRFLGEIPRDLLDWAGSYREPFETAEPWDERRRVVPEHDLVGDDGLAPGTFVQHPDFGPGRVIDIEGTGESLKVTVQFDAGFRKRILVRYGYIQRL